MAYLFYLIPSMVILLFAWWISKEITIKEVLVQLLAQMALIGLMTFMIFHSNNLDTEVWNGVISSKERKVVSCSHSYSCRCRPVCTGSGKTGSCSTKCDTCYKHSYDVSWYAFNNIGESFTISRVNSQGTIEPPRWSSIRKGDPTSTTHSYQNYIKGNPSSLFRDQGLKSQFKGQLPTYPEKIYDYYKLNRLVSLGVSVDKDLWNNKISEINGRLGKEKQVNFVVVLTKNKPTIYANALGQHWLGGKKNDVILLIDVNDSLEINWAEVISLTYPDFKVNLRNDINIVKTLSIDVLDIAETRIKNSFKRRPMSDFEYLNAAVMPSTNQWIFGLLFSIILSLGLSYLFHKIDLDEKIRRW